MKFNTKIKYSLRTMIELAMVKTGQGLLQKDIASNQEISLKYLDFIIAALKKSGLVVNVRGKKSGYKLAKNPAEISVKEVFQVFDKELINMACLSAPWLCKRYHICTAKFFWKDFNNKMLGFLKSITLQDLSNQEKKTTADKPFIYNI